MLAETTTFTLDGISAKPVRVEVDVQRGLPAFQIVGLPDAAVREARERVRAALVNCGFEFPLMRITANLAPADLRKAGPGLDLALAAALLGASGEIPMERLDGWSFAGELALDGSVRGVRGALAMAEQTREMRLTGILVPSANGSEAALAADIAVRSISNVAELRQIAAGKWTSPPPEPLTLRQTADASDMADLRGQAHLRRGLEVAAAGAHGLLIVGPPGAGKSMAARRITSILPPLGGDQLLDVARIASACGTPFDGTLTEARPFRSPHHTVSTSGLIGGGSPPRPGEVTLAHHGVLFLDELCEFRRPALEALREPLEVGEVEIVRATGRRVLPSRFTLVAAANPCPCGRGEEDPGCRCSAAAIAKYGGALSGALADRIDINLVVGQPGAEAMAGPPGEPSSSIRERVIAARDRMNMRLGGGRTNAAATRAEIAEFKIAPGGVKLLESAHRASRLSGRAHDRVLRLARTIADLAGSGPIAAEHVAEALQMRRRGSK